MLNVSVLLVKKKKVKRKNIITYEELLVNICPACIPREPIRFQMALPRIAWLLLALAQPFTKQLPWRWAE